MSVTKVAKKAVLKVADISAHASKTRKPNEKWTDAIKRSTKELKAKMK
jgi:hypothetical protein